MHSDWGDATEEDILDDPITLYRIDGDNLGGTHQPLELEPPVTLSSVTNDDSWYQKGETDSNLPTSFFEVDSNVELLNECCPLTINIVDCDKHPWYYRKYKRSGVMDEHADKIKSCKNKPQVERIPYMGNKLTLGSKKSIYKDSVNVDLEKNNAIKQKNTSKVDFKKNIGLVGLTITAVEENDCDKINEHIPNDLDKVLNSYGTEIIPVVDRNNQCTTQKLNYSSPISSIARKTNKSKKVSYNKSSLFTSKKLNKTVKDINKKHEALTDDKEVLYKTKEQLVEPAISQASTEVKDVNDIVKTNEYVNDHLKANKIAEYILKSINEITDNVPKTKDNEDIEPHDLITNIGCDSNVQCDIKISEIHSGAENIRKLTDLQNYDKKDPQVGLDDGIKKSPNKIIESLKDLMKDIEYSDDKLLNNSNQEGQVNTMNRHEIIPLSDDSCDSFTFVNNQTKTELKQHIIQPTNEQIIANKSTEILPNKSKNIIKVKSNKYSDKTNKDKSRNKKTLCPSLEDKKGVSKNQTSVNHVKQDKAQPRAKTDCNNMCPLPNGYHGPAFLPAFANSHHNNHVFHSHPPNIRHSYNFPQFMPPLTNVATNNSFLPYWPHLPPQFPVPTSRLPPPLTSHPCKQAVQYRYNYNQFSNYKDCNKQHYVTPKIASSSCPTTKTNHTVNDRSNNVFQFSNYKDFNKQHYLTPKIAPSSCPTTKINHTVNARSNNVLPKVNTIPYHDESNKISTKLDKFKDIERETMKFKTCVPKKNVDMNEMTNNSLCVYPELEKALKQSNDKVLPRKKIENNVKNNHIILTKDTNENIQYGKDIGPNLLDFSRYAPNVTFPPVDRTIHSSPTNPEAKLHFRPDNQNYVPPILPAPAQNTSQMNFKPHVELILQRTVDASMQPLLDFDLSCRKRQNIDRKDSVPRKMSADDYKLSTQLDNVRLANYFEENKADDVSKNTINLSKPKKQIAVMSNLVNEDLGYDSESSVKI